jgi:hypothetical protein
MQPDGRSPWKEAEVEVAPPPVILPQQQQQQTNSLAADYSAATVSVHLSAP